MNTQFTVRHYARIGSTNDELRRLVSEGAQPGTVVHADEQSKGRGRLARNWFSPPGNLYLSILLCCDQPERRSAELSFLSAVAVAETVRKLLPAQAVVRLKWPNDVLVDEAKISGILLEQVGDALIVGIGLNILEAPSLEAYRTTTIAAQGGIATVDGARDILLEQLQTLTTIWTDLGFEPIRQAWLAMTYPIGSPIRIATLNGIKHGQFAGLDTDGALLLETEGRVYRHVAGDVSM